MNTRNRRLFGPTWGFLALLVSWLAAAPAAAEQLRLTYSGAGSATEIDLNDDGTTAILALGTGKGSLGTVSTHSVFDARVRAPRRCAANEIENELVAASNVIQDKRGNQLVLILERGVLCADPTFSGFSLTVDEVIAGGTGAYAGASGKARTTCSGVFLAVDLTDSGGRAAHVAFSCEVKGRLD